MMRVLKKFVRSTRGASAIEFAAALPFMTLLLFGGYASTQAVAVGRKVTITTRALADLTSQYSTMSTGDIATVINASAQIMAPFSSTPLSIRLSQITTDVTGLIPKAIWSQVVNQTAYTKNQVVTLPLAMLKPSTSYILSEVSYKYTPSVFKGVLGPYAISDSLYMVPRISASVTCTNCP